jgi:nicotinate-nucleotide adenylyltransferase
VRGTPEIVGVLGGTFDPVHLGHVGLAERAAEALGLGRVLFVLSARPPHKPGGGVTPADHRLAMLDLAVEGRPGLEVSTVELDRDGPSFTVDTLRHLRAGPPSVRPVFLLGRDALFELPTWHDWRSIATEFDLVVADRPDDEPGENRGALHPFLEERRVRLERSDPGVVRGLSPPLGDGGRILHLPLPEIAISSREIRARVRSGGSMTGLVPPSVASYIREYRLYSEGGNRP